MSKLFGKGSQSGPTPLVPDWPGVVRDTGIYPSTLFIINKHNQDLPVLIHKAEGTPARVLRDLSVEAKSMAN